MITPLAVSDICECMQNLLTEKCKVYKLNFKESLDIVNTFATGWEMLCTVSAEPGKHPDLEKYVKEDVAKDFEVPDDLSSLEE